MEETTQKQFEDELEQIFNLKLQLEAESKVLKEKNKLLDEKKAYIIEALEGLGKTAHEGRVCKAYITTKLDVKCPQLQEDREAFFEYLKKKGVYDGMIGVNYQTLNSFYKQEADLELSKGNIDFKMPGIGEPNYRKTLNFRKIKKEKK